MKYLLVLVSVLWVFSGCSAQKKTSQNSLIHFDSPIKYRFGSVEGDENAAMVADSPVSWSQLRSQDVALQELESTLNQKALAFVVTWASSLSKQNQNSKVQVTFHGMPVEDVQSVVNDEKGLWDDNVSVEFGDEHHQVGELASSSQGRISWDEFLSANINHSQLYSKVFNQRMNRLDGIVARRFLLKAARKADMAMEAFVKQEIVKQAFEPSDEQVKSYGLESGISESDLNEDLIVRLKPIMVQKDRDLKVKQYVASQWIKKPVVVAFPEPQIKVEVPPMLDAIPQWGRGDKEPALIYVGHWNCEKCQSPLQTFLQSKKAFSSQLRGAFVYMFPKTDREARMGAEAGLCVKSQSENAFWMFMGKMSEPTDQDVESQINSIAESVGIDYSQFRDCFLKREHQEAVDQHLMLAEKMGVSVSPLMILKGQVIPTSIELSGLTQKINDMGLSAGSSGLWSKIKAFLGMG